MTTTYVKGRIGTRDVPKTVPVSVVSAPASEQGKLPLTGFNVLFQVILGGLAVAGGAALYRRSALV
jgi:LPXTG-motif cell wall-anchored protein